LDIHTILRQNESLQGLSDADLDFLSSRGNVREHDAGDYIFRKGEPADELIIVLRGRVRVYVLQRDTQREVATFGASDITGLLPYSRMTHAQGYAQLMEPGAILTLHKRHFREMIVDYHNLTEALVHFMSSRIRSFTTLNMQNEKLLSLGKLSAGLAHELNNPASAMVRSSSSLMEHLKLVPETFKGIMAMKVSAQQVEQVGDWLFKVLERERKPLTMIERANNEDALLDTLEGYGLQGAMEVAEELTDFGLNAADLEALHHLTGEAAFIPTLKWISDNLTTDKVVSEINASALRISELIQSIKRYSYMDQGRDRQAVNVNEGLLNTLQLLRHRSKGGNVAIAEDLDDGLPLISAFPGELNQVWTNLMDNALDAMEKTGGTLRIATCHCPPNVEVRISDTGEGIPEEVQSKIFDPFFTTKPIGKGTGLGLDVVSKIIRQHGAQISLESRPGFTEFLLKFPIEEQK
jgi:signal transduction histidine kinase